MSISDPLEQLDHATAAGLVPELLLVGQLIDRAGMPALLREFGVDGMRDVAVEEWLAASPHYTRRMKEALRIDGDGVAEIFKGFQLDVGAPPEFMDFRYTVTDHDHGEFHLDHCGALMDVEGMGDELVRTMCHHIEDPTFPGSAHVTNPHAVVEAVHRPPRRPAGRTPFCHWTVEIDPEAEPFATPQEALESASSRAVSHTFAPPAPVHTAGEGTLDDYSGPLLSDLHFPDFTADALVRIVREVYLQMHLLAIGFHQSVRRRTDRETADRLLDYQATGIAGIAAERLRDLLGVGGDARGLKLVLDLHPLAGPTSYTGYSSAVSADGESLTVRWDSSADAYADDSWASLLAAGDVRPLEAAAHGVDPRWTASPLSGVGSGTVLETVLSLGAEPAPEAEEVAVTRFSTGAAFRFGAARTPIPITPV